MKPVFIPQLRVLLYSGKNVLVIVTAWKNVSRCRQVKPAENC
jgi:hypothetical protein